MVSLGFAAEALWKRAFGGELVADSPNSTDDLRGLAGKSFGGLSAAVEHFSKHSDSSNGPALFFLVGGPGAGKSSLAKELVADLSEIEAPSNSLAQRRHMFQGNKRKLILINDATMSENGETISLGSDVTVALETGSDLVVCVNRGVFVEEFANANNPFLIDKVLRYVAGRDWPEDLEALDSVNSGTWKSVEFDREGQRVSLIAAYLDSTSLLRTSPVTGISANPLQIGGPAVEMLGNLFGELAVEPVFEIAPEPISSNIASLQNPQIFNSFVKLLLKAETANGSVFNYRTLWGIASRAIFGGLPGAQSISDPFSGVPADLVHLDFSTLKELSVIRSHQSIYGTEESSASLFSSGQSSQTKVFERIDPLRSSLVEEAHTDDVAGAEKVWFSLITDAFFSVEEGISPLESLLSTVPTNDPFREYVTGFDRALDSSFLDELGMITSGSTRQALISWYSKYLVRAYAFANGFIGNSTVVRLLDEIRDSEQIPDQEDLGRRLLALLRPRRYSGEADGSALLTLFDSRVSPVIGDLKSPKLAIKASELNLSIKRNENDVILQLTEYGRPVGEVNLDFELVYEALAWLPGYAGITDSATAVIPRIERLRASRLTPQNLASNQNSIVVALETSDRQIKLSSREEV